MKPIQRLFIFDRKEIFVLTTMILMVSLFTFTLGIHLGKRVGNRTWVGSHTEASAVHTLADHVPNRQELTEQAKGVQQALEEALTQELHDEVIRTGLKLDAPRQLQLPQHTISENAGATSLASHSDHGSHATHVAKNTHHSSGSHESHSSHDTHQTENRKIASEDHSDHPTTQASHHDTSDTHATAHSSAHSDSHSAGHSPTHKDAHSTTHPVAHSDAHHENHADAHHHSHSTTPADSHHGTTFTLQIGSFPNLAEAKKQLSALQKAELKAYLHEAEIKGKGKWYRLYLGGYSSREAAEEAGEKYKTQNKIHSFIVTKSPS